MSTEDKAFLIHTHDVPQDVPSPFPGLGCLFVGLMMLCYALQRGRL